MAEKKKGFTEEERAAMKERAQELKAEGRPRGAKKPDGESEVLAKIAQMQAPDRVMAKRLQAAIKAAAPDLAPRLWYGMPAYSKDARSSVSSKRRRSSRQGTRPWASATWPTSTMVRCGQRIRAEEVRRGRRGEGLCAREKGGWLSRSLSYRDERSVMGLVSASIAVPLCNCSR